MTFLPYITISPWCSLFTPAFPISIVTPRTNLLPGYDNTERKSGKTEKRRFVVFYQCMQICNIYFARTSHNAVCLRQHFRAPSLARSLFMKMNQHLNSKLKEVDYEGRKGRKWTRSCDQFIADWWHSFMYMYCHRCYAVYTSISKLDNFPPGLCLWNCISASVLTGTLWRKKWQGFGIFYHYMLIGNIHLCSYCLFTPAFPSSIVTPGLLFMKMNQNPPGTRYIVNDRKSKDLWFSTDVC